MTGVPFPNCTYCRKPILDLSKAAQRVTGWQVKAKDPSRRGGADVKCRERLDEFCCLGCLQVLAMGMNPGQESLLGDAA